MYRAVVHAPAVGVPKVLLAAFTTHLPLDVRGGVGGKVRVLQYRMECSLCSRHLFSLEVAHRLPPAICVQDGSVCVNGSLVLWFGWVGDERVASLHDEGCMMRDRARPFPATSFFCRCVFLFFSVFVVFVRTPVFPSAGVGVKSRSLLDLPTTHTVFSTQFACWSKVCGGISENRHAFLSFVVFQF